MPVAQIADHTITYTERGAGPPIVFLHGWPVDSREFVRQIAALSDDHRAIAWDAPGAGGSTDPAEGASLGDWADWLAAFFAALDLDSAHVAGLSWGGGLALAFADRHPDLVRSLVLMGAYAGWGGSLSPADAQRRLELYLENTMLQPEEWVPATLETLLAPGAEQQVVDELTAMLAASHPAAGRVALTAFAQADLRDALPRLDVPTLMLYGELDVRAPREVWEPLHQAIRGSRLIVIPDAGHVVDMQAPDRCNAEIKAFVDEVERSRGR